MVKSLIILSIYISILGYSVFIKNIFFKKNQKDINSFDLTFGLIFLYFLSFLINFVFPLKYFSIYIFFIGLIFFILFFKLAIKNISLYLLITILSVAIIIEPNSLAADTHFYHLQIIKWYSNEKAVFGLANLESRLGLVSGWHHLVSVFNFSFRDINFLYLINTLPFIILTERVLKIENKKNFYLHEIFLYSVFLFLIIFAIIHPTLNGTILNTMGSADADSAGTYFFICSFYFFLKYIEEEKDKDFVYLITLVTLSYLAKISNIFLILLPLYLLIFYNLNLKKFKNYIFFLIIINLFWFIKIVISTGCLVYPLEFTCFDFNWSYPKDMISKLILEYSAFPRSKNNLDVHYHNYEYYIYSYNWFHKWFINYFIQISFIQICFLLILISLILIIIKFFSNNLLFNKKILLFLFVFFIININYWLIAPDIRYAYGIFICMTLVILSFALKNYIKFFIKFFEKKNIIFLSLLLILVSKNLKYHFINDNIFVENRKFNYSNIKFVKKENNYNIYKTSDGNCAFFQEICVYIDPKNLRINKLHNYIFISHEK